MRSAPWLPCAFVCAVAVAVHIPTTGFDFVFDDHHLIGANQFLREPWSPVTAFAHDFWHGTRGLNSYYRPVVIASLALNGRLLGWGPAGFHAVNVLLHAANALLVLLLARRRGAPTWAATLGGCLFAAHPAGSWAVASIVARVDLLPALFVLLAWLAFAGPASAPEPAAPGRTRAALLTGAAFLAALLCKESAAAFLVVPILALRSPDRPPGAWSPAGGLPVADGPRRAAAALAASVAALVAYAILRAGAGTGTLLGGLVDPVVNPLGALPPAQRLVAALALSGRYLLHLFVPVRFRDPIDYGDPASLPAATSAGVLFAAGLFAVWGLAVVVLWLRRDRLALPLAFSLASFLPASNLTLPITSLYALNFLYMPLAGLCLAVADLAGRLRGRAVARAGGLPAVAWPAVPLVALLGFASIREASIWRDGVTLASAWTERFPRYALGYVNLGDALLGRGEPAAALAPLRAALAIDDRSMEAHNNLAVAISRTDPGPGGMEEALGHLRAAITLAPDFIDLRVNASRLLLELGRDAEAEVEARAATARAPGHLQARSYLAESLHRQRKYAEAADEFGGLASSQPGDPAWRASRLVCLIEAGDLETARREAGEARRDFPGNGWFDFCLARVEARDGHARESLALLEQAIRKTPEARRWIEETPDFDRRRADPDFRALIGDRGPRPGPPP